MEFIVNLMDALELTYIEADSDFNREAEFKQFSFDQHQIYIGWQLNDKDYEEKTFEINEVAEAVDFYKKINIE